MSEDSVRMVGRVCDECGKSVVTFSRVYLERRYCSTCYARIFKLRKCPSCQKIARLPKDDLGAVCQRCFLKRPCCRCGKSNYDVGKVTRYGPVCNSCSVHFREAEKCELCGRFSTRLSRVSRLGHDHRVCPKCACADYGTCRACHHHRLLEQGADGQKLCKTCRTKGVIRCPECGVVMPAGRGNRCEECYWKKLLVNRTAFDCAAFSSAEMAEHFRNFSKWLGERVGVHKAALVLHRYLQFFLRIEHTWGGVPSYQQLLNLLGVYGLRKSLLPTRWMSESKLIIIDERAKMEDSENRRIQSILGSLKEGTRARCVLERYYETLMEKLVTGDIKLRSVRLALSPAAQLMSISHRLRRALPCQKDLDMLLRNSPGQRSAVYGFVRYLRFECGIDLEITNVEENRARRRKELRMEMLALMREPADSDGFRQRWIPVALAYFHGLSMKVINTMKWSDSKLVDKDGLAVMWRGQEYWISMPKYKER